MNFYGWQVAGLLVCGASIWLVWRAFHPTDTLSTEQFLLLAIWVMVIGQFCIAWQSYLARVAEKLDAQKRKGIDDHAA